MNKFLLLVPLLMLNSSNVGGATPSQHVRRVVGTANTLETEWEIYTQTWSLKTDTVKRGIHSISVQHGLGYDHLEFQVFTDPQFPATSKKLDDMNACRSRGGVLLGSIADTPGANDLTGNKVIKAVGRPESISKSLTRDITTLNFQFGDELVNSAIFLEDSTQDGKTKAYVKFCVAFSLQSEDQQTNPSITKDMNIREVALLMAIELDGNVLDGDKILAVKTMAAEDIVTEDLDDDPLAFGVTAEILRSYEVATNDAARNVPLVPGEVVSVCAYAEDFPLTAVADFRYLSFNTQKPPARRHRTLKLKLDIGDNSDIGTTVTEATTVNNNAVTTASNIEQVVINANGYDASVSGPGGIKKKKGNSWANANNDDPVYCRCWDTILNLAFFDMDDSNGNGKPRSMEVYVDGVIDLMIGEGLRVRRELNGAAVGAGANNNNNNNNNDDDQKNLDPAHHRQLQPEEVQEKEFQAVITLQQVAPESDSGASHSRSWILEGSTVLLSAVLLVALGRAV